MMRRLLKPVLCVLAAAVFVFCVPACSFALGAGDYIQCPVCGSGDCVVVDFIEPYTEKQHQEVYYNCNSCGSNGSYLIHQYYMSAYTAPTCTEYGLAEYSCSCNVPDPATVVPCTASYSEYLLPTGHTEIIDKGVDPTCVENGLTEGSHCSVCGTVIRKQEVIKSTGHTAEVVDAVFATCTEDGHTEGKQCSVCGVLLGRTEEVPALGHNWDDGIVTKKATRDEEGLKTFTCKRCGITRTESIAVKNFPVKEVVVGAVLIGIAAAAASLAAKISKIRKAAKLLTPDLSRKTVYLVQDKDEHSKELSKLLASKRFLITENYDIDDCEDLPKDVKNGGPDLIILEVDEDHDLEKVKALMEKIDAEDEGTYAITADLQMDSDLEEELKKMKDDEKIIGYSGRIDSVKALIDLILPIYKPELTFDDGVESIGKIADMFGIDGVSKVTGIYSDGKSVLKTLKKDASLTNVASVIGSIASIMGWDKVGDVTDLIDQIDTNKGYMDEEIERQKILNDYEEKDKKTAKKSRKDRKQGE